MILLIDYNSRRNQFEICLIATFKREDINSFIKFYSYLKSNFNFKPKLITCDFLVANIEAIKTVFENDNTLIISCLFHLVQCWWRNTGKLGLRKKAIVLRSINLIFNLKLLPFMDLENARNFYITLKDYFSDEEFDNFYIYIELTWLNLDDNSSVKFEFNI